MARQTHNPAPGPAEYFSKELVAGFWLWQVRSMEEAVEWVKRIPAPGEGDPGFGEVSDIEMRPVFEAADFGAEFTPELREQEGMRCKD